MTDHDPSAIEINADPMLHGHSDGSDYDPDCRDCQIKRAAAADSRDLGAPAREVISISGMPPLHYGPAPFEQAKRGAYCLAGGPIIEVGPDNAGKPQQACICDRSRPVIEKPEAQRGFTLKSGELPVRGFEAADWPVKVPKVLRVVRRGNRPAQLFIDGEPFGYATLGGFTAGPTRKAELPAVTFTLVGYRVEFVDDMDADGGGA